MGSRRMKHLGGGSGCRASCALFSFACFFQCCDEHRACLNRRLQTLHS